jgi:hypothetical protein
VLKDLRELQRKYGHVESPNVQSIEKEVNIRHTQGDLRSHFNHRGRILRRGD